MVAPGGRGGHPGRAGGRGVRAGAAPGAVRPAGERSRWISSGWRAACCCTPGACWRASRIYAPPSLDFIPYLYTPLYPALLALLSKLLPFGYLLGRGLSIAAFVGALALLVVVAARQGGPAFATGGWSPGRDRWLGLPTAVGVAAAGLVAASFAFTGSFYDLVRADSLLLLLEAAALTAALLGGGLPSAAVAGLLIALAFFTKQTASAAGCGHRPGPAGRGLAAGRGVRR